MALFADRRAAGRELATALGEWRGTDAVVLGIPRGGVVVAAAVAEALGLELDAVVVRKLGASGHEEFAVGAIADGVRIVTPDAVRWAGMSATDLERVEAAERDELARRTDAYGSRLVDLTGRTALVVDDGVATGASAVAACRAVRARHPDRVVLAVPVAPERFMAPADAADDFVCPHRESDFWAVGEYYDHFGQTSDREVVALLLAASTGSTTGDGH
ncbi:phosphoribosyltransferase family protein [Microbacterium sp. QXD-8]|uniref:Phosphoribosyltransferase family protein n=1 Tax=Microbacterium psychrotolerans TaxID=3068321 RepID=A0ABU0YZW2_9MICO|nr:phosphoribosyltransferase family protein [Microbacterium sp. QXD-8]MDQ7877864.1 phosphoribosyltransferase family protein [Microbacterium sp. QXD-8]